MLDRLPLKDLGWTLPIGLEFEGRLLKEYSLREYAGFDDKRLGELEDSLPEGEYRFLKILDRFLPTFIDSIEGYSVDYICKQKNIPPGHFLGEMYLVDVMALVLQLRRFAHGDDLYLGGRCICDRATKMGRQPHDLGYLEFPCYRGESPPVVEVELWEGVVREDDSLLQEFKICPPRFGQLPALLRDDYPYAMRMLFLNSEVTFDDYCRAWGEDLDILSVCGEWADYGPGLEIGMWCNEPGCDREWSYWLQPGCDRERFYLGLLSSPRENEEIGATSDYLSQIAFFLTFGEQAPFKSLVNVLELSPRERERYIKMTSETYEKQHQEHEKAMKKSRSR